MDILKVCLDHIMTFFIIVYVGDLDVYLRGYFQISLFLIMKDMGI